VGPTPIGVESDGAGLGSAALSTRSGTLRPRHLGVGLSREGANLLSSGGPEEGERCEGYRPVHDA
jgi:hypothetical protein